MERFHHCAHAQEMLMLERLLCVNQGERVPIAQIYLGEWYGRGKY